MGLRRLYTHSTSGRDLWLHVVGPRQFSLHQINSFLAALADLLRPSSHRLLITNDSQSRIEAFNYLGKV
ncbi:hypothetical protein GQ607_010368 [Colletotrichum asianum]|uniref:Uncharacterized protein n=1 Tax=Colletotrichum asianum TaxID=702518 RepID=A0A8H3WAE4_9PEZI|nr:hypothetical protein GQ607_010368 [Colletotrichum asianum]